MGSYKSSQINKSKQERNEREAGKSKEACRGGMFTPLFEGQIPTRAATIKKSHS